eukprot:5866612-Amphidinium_carterae.2
MVTPSCIEFCRVCGDDSCLEPQPGSSVLLASVRQSTNQLICLPRVRGAQSGVYPCTALLDPFLLVPAQHLACLSALLSDGEVECVSGGFWLSNVDGVFSVKLVDCGELLLDHADGLRALEEAVPCCFKPSCAV